MVYTIYLCIWQKKAFNKRHKLKNTIFKSKSKRQAEYEYVEKHYQK